MNIIVVGDGGVGKTAFINGYQGEYIGRRGFEEYSIMCNKQAIWRIDVGGQEKFAKCSYKECVDGAIIMFDVH